ncbi:MAG TPA: glycosyltransferase [Candidatus Binataceae bacterium]
MPTWHIITAEYPPTAGGVADYSKIVAEGLNSAGDHVHVWTPASAAARSARNGIELHELPGHFGPRALAALSRGLGAVNADCILVQYVPHAFGLKAMNLPFCLWLAAQRGRNVTVMFHEVAYPVERGQRLRHNFLGTVTHLMALIVARAAGRIFVATPEWERTLRKLIPSSKPIVWLPVPSNIPVIDDREASRSIRSRYSNNGALLLGHFSTYGGEIAGELESSLCAVLPRIPESAVLLVGRNSDQFRVRFAASHLDFSARVHASGQLAREDLSLHLSACDLMLQPYRDGICTRHGSAMAAVAHGRPIVSTFGRLSEPLWAESGAVALAPAGDAAGLAAEIARLAADETGRQRLGRTASELYKCRFDIKHTIGALRSA